MVKNFQWFSNQESLRSSRLPSNTTQQLQFNKIEAQSFGLFLKSFEVVFPSVRFVGFRLDHWNSSRYFSR